MIWHYLVRGRFLPQPFCGATSWSGGSNDPKEVTCPECLRLLNIRRSQARKKGGRT